MAVAKANIKTNHLADQVVARLDKSVLRHFDYQKLFPAGIELSEKEKVGEFLQNEYLEGKSLEEFAIEAICSSINKEMGKYEKGKSGNGYSGAGSNSSANGFSAK